MNQFFLILNIVLVVILLAFLINWAWVKILTKKIGGKLSNDEFEKTMRKAQIIDLRSKEAFHKKHILGARSLPYTMFKYQYQEIRPDLPVYLYSDAQTMTLRAARFLKKKGYQKICWLADGFDQWQGKTKQSKY